MEICFKCHTEKPIDDFYKHPKMANGHLGKCKDCTKLDVSNRSRTPDGRTRDRARRRNNERRKQQWRDQSKRQRLKPENKIKNSARLKLRRAVLHGLIQKSLCVVCGSINVHAHHQDYSRPYDIIWLCPLHHSAVHVGEIDWLSLPMQSINIIKVRGKHGAPTLAILSALLI